jgi:hypothetical protein
MYRVVYKKPSPELKQVLICEDFIDASDVFVGPEGALVFQRQKKVETAGGDTYSELVATRAFPPGAWFSCDEVDPATVQDNTPRSSIIQP